ncbi:MAG: 3-oxoacyl-ACP reductase FabG [Candidatus Omnitrophica bacterium]|nr:3-oxoacyl-ACP reductase FabG [Candidatus Omnitrophota bacterium]
MSVLRLFELTGKKALVTGASRGLGKAMAIALAQAGCDLALNARNEGSLGETAQAIRKEGRQVCLVAGDVSNEADVKRICEGANQQMGRIDVLVNNAGVWEGSYVIRMQKADWDRVITTNLTGSFLMAKAAAKIMLKQRSGKIIQVSSILGLAGGPQSVAYSAAKAGVVQLTRVMAIELGPAGIQVNAIAPGYFKTDMTKQYESDPALKAYIDKIPAKRVGEPEDLAGLIVFLASRASDHITGQVIVIDGGEILV